jgi:hypothetical protein
MSKKSSTRGAPDREALSRAPSREGSSSRDLNFLLFAPWRITSPVKISRVLTRHGMSLAGAHSALDRLVRGDYVEVKLGISDPFLVLSELRQVGIAGSVRSGSLLMSSEDVRSAIASLGLAKLLSRKESASKVNYAPTFDNAGLRRLFGKQERAH